MPEPILKWAGGKRQLLSQIRTCFPHREEINRYHEPFFGGGAVFFKEAHEYTATINDINKRLMNFYWVVREYPNELVTRADVHKPGEDYYYEARDKFNKLRKELDNFEQDINARVEEASLLLYLNRTCYNGLYRENSKGEFNVPYGDISNPNYRQESRIQEASKILQGVKILNNQFDYVENYAEEGDLVYFDPPYKPVSKTSSFVEYSSDAFGKEDQERLRDLAVRLNDQGVHVVVSNSHVMGDIYRGLEEFEVVPVGARRSINSDADNRGEIQEIIVTNVQNRRARETSIGQFTQEVAE